MNAIRHELVRRELATRSLAGYIRRMDDQFIFDPFQTQLCDYLDAFLQACEEKKSPRLMIFAPPRSGKSEVVSRNFPTYVIGKHPDWEIIAASATDGLAKDFGLWVSNRLNAPMYQDTFQGFSPDPSRNSTMNIRTTKNGGYVALGVGTQVVGKGCTIGIVDDPVAGIQQALSEVEREALFSWYMANLQSRLAPGGGILLMHQRWHPDDLAARLISASKKDPNASKWTVLSYPALAEEDDADPLKRKKGEALVPSRWPRESLIRIKADLVSNGRSRDWFAMYQQTPIVEGGAFFKKDHLKYWKEFPEDLTYLICADYAVTESNRGDKTAIFCLGVDHQGSVYVMDTFHWGRWGSLEIVRLTIALAKKHNARVLATEKGPIQGALNPLFDREMAEEDFYLTIDRTARRSSKMVVAHALRGLMEAGKFYFPDQPTVHEELIPNMLSFSDETTGDDDAVDALALGALCIENIGRPLPPSVVIPSWKKKGEVYMDDVFKSRRSSGKNVPGLRSNSW
jgi:predicted phage terminase large subunit-like protein